MIRSFSALLLLSTLFPLNSHASPKIVTFVPGASPVSKSAGLEKLGAKITKDLPLINAVVADFPAKIADAAILSAPQVEAVGEDLVIKWIEEVPQPLPLSYINTALAVSRGVKTPAAVRAALKKAAVSIGLQPEEEGAGLVDAAKLLK